MRSFGKTLLVTVVIVAAYFLFTSLRGNTGTDIRFEGSAIHLTAPEKFSCSIPYDGIAGLELVEWAPVSAGTAGGETRRYIWGEWEHGEFGPCTLCITKKIDSAILVTETDGDRILFNYESEQTTAALLDAIRKMLAESAA